MKPRVFVSSTYYDLRYLRTSLQGFIESLGFEAILSEKGAITYSPDFTLDESCYREVTNADILVLIIGGRYGSPSSKQKLGNHRDSHALYESITRGEYETAARQKVPTYILIESSVYADFENFCVNSGNNRIKYAHVDSINIFHFVRDILGRSMNNPVCKFATFADIQDFLGQQWAGLFRELLRRRSDQHQIAGLSAQIAALSKLNETLRTYVEALLQQLEPKESQRLIRREEVKLREAEVYTEFVVDDYWHGLSRLSGKSLEDLFSCLKEAKSLEDIVTLAFGSLDRQKAFIDSLRQSMTEQEFLGKVNVIRVRLGLGSLPQPK